MRAAGTLAARVPNRVHQLKEVRMNEFFESSEGLEKRKTSKRSRSDEEGVSVTRKKKEKERRIEGDRKRKLREARESEISIVNSLGKWRQQEFCIWRRELTFNLRNELSIIEDPCGKSRDMG